MVYYIACPSVELQANPQKLVCYFGVAEQRQQVAFTTALRSITVLTISVTVCSSEATRVSSLAVGDTSAARSAPTLTTSTAEDLESHNPLFELNKQIF